MKIKLVKFDRRTNTASYNNSAGELVVFSVYKSCCEFAKDAAFTKKINLKNHKPILIFE